MLYARNFIILMVADIKDQELEDLISGPNVAGKYFFGDENCPIDWEPSGFDFLSPCLQVLQRKKISRNIQLSFRILNLLNINTIQFYQGSGCDESNAYNV